MEPSRLDASSPLGAGLFKVAVAGFNSDGKPDMVTGGFNSHTIFVLQR